MRRSFLAGMFREPLDRKGGPDYCFKSLFFLLRRLYMYHFYVFH